MKIELSVTEFLELVENKSKPVTVNIADLITPSFIRDQIIPALEKNLSLRK